MQIDWNWFFAAYAQSAAALIGVLSAFIISKLLGESDKYEQILNTLNKLNLKRNYYLDKISVYKFKIHDKQSIKYSYSLGKAINNGEFHGLADDEKLKKMFELDQSLFQTENCLSYLKERIEEVANGNIPFGQNHSIKIPELNIPPEGMWDKLAEEKDKLIDLKIDCEFLIKELEETKRNLSKTKTNLKPLKITIWLLSVGLVITVIYPLHFIPLEMNSVPHISFSFEAICNNLLSLRGVLLVLLFLAIESIFIYFLSLINGLEKKYDSSIQTIEASWLDITEYSQYFVCTVEEERKQKTV